MTHGISYDIILTLARWSLHGFYREIKTVGHENVPKEGPLIACSTHSNMIVDAAVLASTFPHKRKLYYWAKDSIFANKYVRAILDSSGVLPVDRKTKNNQILFASTFDALKKGGVVGLFPEGTSHSQTRLLDLKDGASWAALEYMKLVQKTNDDTLQKENLSKVLIVPCGITYVQKTKYRSVVVSAFGPPIDVELFVKDFEQNPRATVKLLTKEIEREMEKLSINAKNIETLTAAHMTRLLLFSDDKYVALEDFVKITQSLVNFFDETSADEVTNVKNLLNQYQNTLHSLGLNNIDIARYETRDLTLQSALYNLLSDSCKSLVQLPFFLPGLLFHWPTYLLGKVSAKYEIYEECKAQNKIILGLAWLIITYSILFFAIWIAMLFTPLGLVLAGGFVFIFAWYHVALIDSHYDTLKEVISSYYICIALLCGKGSDAYGRIENLVAARRACISFLKKIVDDYRHKNSDLRFVMEYRERVDNEKAL